MLATVLCEGGETVRFPLLPLSHDSAAIGLAEFTLAMRQVCVPTSLIPAAVRPPLVADALLRVADPLA